MPSVRLKPNAKSSKWQGDAIITACADPFLGECHRDFFGDVAFAAGDDRPAPDSTLDALRRPGQRCLPSIVTSTRARS
jgi:hypothetical protein